MIMKFVRLGEPSPRRGRHSLKFVLFLMAGAALGPSAWAQCQWTMVPNTTYIQAAGCTRVGVGTSAPDSYLQVNGQTSQPSLHLNNSNGDMYLGPDGLGNPYLMSAGVGKFLYFWVNGAERIRI